MYMLLTRDDAKYFILNFLIRLLESWLLELLALNFASNLWRFSSFQFFPTKCCVASFGDPYFVTCAEHDMRILMKACLAALATRGGRAPEGRGDSLSSVLHFRQESKSAKRKSGYADTPDCPVNAPDRAASM
jgi:hypothetical protein